MLRRWAGALLLAPLLALTGCSTPASDASMPASSSSSTTTSTTVATTTSTTAPTTTAPPISTTTTTPGLLGALERVWAATPKASCLMVQDGTAVLYERNPDGPVMPASTMKLITATAVLSRLDPGSRLRTTLVAGGPADLTGTVNGDVFLVGGGDPLLATTPFANHFSRPRLVTRLETLADQLRAAGVTHITGRLVGDDGRYDRERYLPSWPTSYRTEHEAGPLSALLVNDGDAAWSPREIPFADPALGATDVVAQLLRERGIAIDGGTATGTAPAGAVELAGLISPTIAEITHEMLLDSNNNAAELLLRELGLRVLGQGSTDAGRRVALETLAGMGMPMAGVAMVDGSGLDRGNRATCRLLTALLTSSPVGFLVAPGLPVAGVSGTLRRRFVNTPVVGRLFAKTGTLQSVAALAGYADGAAGHRLTFAFEANGVGAGQGGRLEDELGLALVTAR